MAKGERTSRKAAKESAAAPKESAAKDAVKAGLKEPLATEAAKGNPKQPAAKEAVKANLKESSAKEAVMTSPKEPAAKEAVKASPKEPAAKEAVEATPTAARGAVKGSPNEPAAKEAAKATPREPEAKEAVRPSPKDPAAKDAAKAAPKETAAKTAVEASPKEPAAKETAKATRKDPARIDALASATTLAQLQESVQRLHAELPQVVRDAEPWQQAAGAAGALLVLVLLLKSLLCRRRPARPLQKTRSWSEAEEDDVNAFFRRLGARDEPHEEGVLSTPNGNRLIHGNSREAAEYENDVLYGKVLALHQITFDKKKYPDAETKYEPYFQSRKRSWEVRVQFRFKKPVNVQDIFFGIECDEYVPLNFAQRAAMAGLVKMMKAALPQGALHHSCGDDPNKVKADELEKPVFVMPMYAFDGFIVTPEDEEPPRLDDCEDVLNRCKLRSGRVSAFYKEIMGTELKPGPTYTFCFWGISQWLDKLNWKLRGMGVGGKNMNEFCGKPPVHLVIYTMPSEEGTRGPVKHLRSKRESLLHMPFWCSHFRPGYLDSPAESKRIVQGYLNSGPLDARVSGTRERSSRAQHRDKESSWCCLSR